MHMYEYKMMIGSSDYERFFGTLSDQFLRVRPQIRKQSTRDYFLIDGFTASRI